MLNKAMVSDDFHQLPDPTDDESREFQLAFQKQMFLVVARSVETQVKPKTWAAFWQVEIEHNDPTVVAQQLGMTRGALYVAKSRVVAKLRKEVQRRLDETSPYFVSLEKDQRE